MMNNKKTCGGVDGSDNKYLKDTYFGYLRNRIEAPPEYTFLLYFVFEKSYYSPLKMDENRVHDAYKLREDFRDESGIKGLAEERLFEFEINCLEVLIALSERLENDILYNNREGNRTKEWFWMFIKNLGLDGLISGEVSREEVIEKLDIWLERKYQKDGKNGNIIVLKGCSSVDLRKTELWDQLQLFGTYNS